MKLSLAIGGPVVAAEGVSLALELSAEGAPFELPHNFENTDAFAVRLLDDEGRELEYADGFTRQARRAPVGTPRLKTPLGSTEIPAGETVLFDVNLLSYIDPPPPGRYRVIASFRAAGADRVVSSEPVDLSIGEHHGGATDVLWDRASMPIAYLLQQHTGEGARTLMQMNSSRRPETYWKGGALGAPDGANPRVAEVDFTPSGTWDHDLGRWVVWSADDEVIAQKTRMAAPVGDPIERPIGAGLVMIGRPIQHEDGGLSIFAVRPEGGGHVLRRLRFDGAMQPRGDEPIGLLRACPDPIALAADDAGRVLVAAGSEGRAPVSLVVIDRSGGSRGIDALTAEDIAGDAARDGDVRLLSARIDLKSDDGRRAALLVSALITRGEDRWLSLIDAPLGADGMPTGDRRPWRVDVEEEWLGEGEEVVWASFARDQQRLPVLVIATSAGRLLNLGAAHDPRPIEDADPRRLRQSTLIESMGSVILFYPTETRGLRARVLATAPERGM